MKNKTRSVYCRILIILLAAVAQTACSREDIRLEEELSIGEEAGDDNLIFGHIASIDFDSSGNIYVLDSRMWRIQKFDEEGEFLTSFPISRGQGPGELTVPGEMAVNSDGTIFVYDFMAWKILVLNLEGEASGSFNLDFYGISIGCYSDGNLIVMGDLDSQLFHIYDRKGRLLRSFGEHFQVPRNLQEFEFPTVKYPQEFYVSPSGRVYVYNPHRYEISVYKNEEKEKRIRGENRAFWPVAVKNGREVTLTGLRIFEAEDRLFAFISSHGEMPHQLDVFQNDRQVASLDIEGYARAMDSEGRIYFSEEEPFPRIVRYLIK